MKSRKYLAGLLSITLFSSLYFPLDVKGESAANMVVSIDQINVREGPGLNYSILQKMEQGDPYSVVSRKNDWVEIELAHGETGWVAAYLVTEASASSGGATISANEVNIRTGAGTSFQVTGSIDKGTSVNIIEESNGWISIVAGNKAGWVAAEFISFSENNDTENSTSTAGATTGATSAGNLNVRSTPSSNGQVIGELNKDVVLSISAIDGEWAQIIFKGEIGWVHTKYIDMNSGEKDTDTSTKQNVSQTALTNENESITIAHDGTNLRSEPHTNAKIVSRGIKGDTYSVLSFEDDWYKISLANGEPAYVAGWLVSTNSNARENEPTHNSNTEKGLPGKVIVLDPGHGGRDQGTMGAQGTEEKQLTLETAKLLKDKLEAAGANVILTRTSDTYLTLPSRVQISHMNAADAYLSIHYDSTLDSSTNGTTSYYYHSYQQPLAKAVNDSLRSSLNMKDRGYRYGDYHVLRENNRKAVLLELGYLSNPAEERKVTTDEYQQLVTNAIFNGLQSYFN